ncbi:MAG: 3D-(3,5/4)-trihydroxycyclohexane-1,2-dione acylhydrolase (decyclizing) [Actinomycetota bacterium]|nr:3D-(3,5/4)-trihydroxycyclohexane-1,2-dione acylhydrolase (decyclizing) [Actinomycetota bacterium]
MSTIRLTTAQAIVLYLSAQRSERDGRERRLIPGIFGIFGHGNVAGIGQALEEHGEGLTYLQARNEQAMVHAAVAFAKASRRTATLACTSSIGPGASNMLTGAALATINRLPVLLLPADTYATRRQGPVLQQLEHPLGGDVSVNDAFRPLARFFDRIARPEQLLTALPEAMRVLTSPDEVGAVVLALHQDVQTEAYAFPARFFAPRTWSLRRAAPQPGAIEAVADLLAGAQRPLIIAGGGVIYSEAEAELEALADAHGILVAETFGGKGAVREPAWWGLGGLGLEGNPACNELARGADAIVCVGTRLTDFATASQSIFQHPEVRFAAINVNDRDAHKQNGIPVVADAREALQALAAALRARGVQPSETYRSEVVERRDRWELERDEALHGAHELGMTQGRLIGVMQDSARPGDTIIAAAGGPPGDLLKVWDATGERRCHLEFGYSCMGYELPAALGVRLAQRDGEVVSFIGDGTFLMNPTEIVTAVQEGLKITVVISENHGFQVIRRLQMLRAGHEFGNEFRARAGDGDSRAGDGGPHGSLAGGRLAGDYLRLDLVKVAEGLGATAFRVRTPEEAHAALTRARATTGPVVIVAETVPHADLPGAGVWWDVAPSETSGDEIVSKLRAEYEADRERLQRWYG